MAAVDVNLTVIHRVFLSFIVSLHLLLSKNVGNAPFTYSMFHFMCFTFIADTSKHLNQPRYKKKAVGSFEAEGIF